MGFGIDHPMIAVNDLDAALAKMIALGFTHNLKQSHPWGTDNYLMLFPGSFIEIITIARPSQTSYADANGFRFARVIEARLRYGDGIAMLALDSQSIAHDHTLVEARGFGPWEPIEFKRIAHSVQRSIETKVTLDIYHDPSQPFMTQFLCQYENPELLRADPANEKHANAVSRLKSIWYISDNIAREHDYFRLIHGTDHIFTVPGGYRIETEKGEIWLLDKEALERTFPSLGDVDAAPARAVAISLETMNLDAAIRYWQEHSVPFEPVREGVVDIPSDFLGGTLLRFEQCEECLL